MKILNNISTKPADGFDKKNAKKEIKALQEEFAVLQTKMYAEGKHSLLIVVQGMDASGKDGLVKNVFKKIPAYGINVKSFKVPSKEELAHDFLWRVHKICPANWRWEMIRRKLAVVRKKKLATFSHLAHLFMLIRCKSDYREVTHRVNTTHPFIAKSVIVIASTGASRQSHATNNDFPE